MAATRRKTRRAKGDGTEWQDKSTGQWRWRIRKNGKDYFVSDADRPRAQAEFRQLKESLEKKLNVKGQQQSLRDWMVYWLDHVVKGNVRASTYNDYNKRCELYITPNLGDYTMIGLTSKLIRAWSTATKDAYALSSATQALAILTRALDVAVEEGILEFNPARAVKPPRVRADETQIDETDDVGRSLTPAQEQTLLDEVRRTDAHHTRSRGARSVGAYALYVLTIRLGFRRGEILGLRWRDVDLDAGVIHIRQQVNHEGQITTPKSPKAKRALPLTDDLVTMLREHKLKLGSLSRAYVFPDETGDHRKPRALDKHFERATQRAGITGFTFHDLRATAITRWRENGVDLEVAAALAGHATIKVTAEIYSDSTMERKREAVNKKRSG